MKTQPLMLHERLGDHLRRSPATRGALYLASAAALLEVVGRLRDREQPYPLERLHLAIAPGVAALTWGFAQLETPRQQVLQPKPGWQRAFLRGAGLGGGAILTVLGVAAARDWVSAPKWGWEHEPAGTAIRSAAFITFGQIAVAWNEEQVFRGYGYEQLRQAMPSPAAGLLLTALFGIAHALDPQIALGEAALGSALMLLREASGDIWAPVGYHWAWNTLQSAVFGPTNGPPSLRPLDLHGPYHWTGKPGLPEPGILSTAVNLLVSVGIAAWLWRRRNTRA